MLALGSFLSPASRRGVLLMLAQEPSPAPPGVMADDKRGMALHQHPKNIHAYDFHNLLLYCSVMRMTKIGSKVVLAYYKRHFTSDKCTDQG